MSNKLTEKLLQGYELKGASLDKTPTGAPANPQASTANQQTPLEPPGASSLAEGESYTISDKPDKFVCSLFEGLKSFEAKSSTTAGKAYIIASTLILTTLLWLKQEMLADLPAVEVIFVSFLITFILNYYFVNGALYKPFIENEENSYSIKLCGGFAVAAVACFFYSQKFITLQTALPIFYSSFFIVILLEALFLKESFKPVELAAALGALIGTVITISGSSETFWNHAVTIAPTTAASVAEPDSMYGFILVAVSAVMMAMIMLRFSKMHAENFATMNHIFTMMIVLFIPIFFPIQGVVTPSLVQWGILIVCGVLTAFATLFFIRSFQLENGSRPAVYLFLQIAFIFIIEAIVNSASGTVGIIGAVVTIGCVALFSQQSEGKVANYAQDKEKAYAQEMNVIRSD